MRPSTSGKSKGLARRVPALSIRTDDPWERTFSLVVSSAQRKPAPSLPTRLCALFDDLKRAEPLREPCETMELIWAHWIDHPDVRAAQRMESAVKAMAAGARDLARPILDDLVRDHPDWAEAWNKRATLAFMDRRDEDSVADIARTLELEPRHFGAILGFAQICLRHGRFEEAKAAFETAVRINPRIDGLRHVVARMASAPRRLH